MPRRRRWPAIGLAAQDRRRHALPAVLLIFAVPISGYFYTYAAGVPVVYLGLWQMPAVIGRTRT
jgi:cytochrome b561